MNEGTGTNFMNLQFAAKSENESFARVTVAAFISQLDRTMDELSDLKTVISEAVTNSIIHGYNNNAEGVVSIQAEIREDMITIIVEDRGEGIEDLELASRYIRPNPNLSGRAWALPLWKTSWMNSQSAVSPAEAPPSR